MFMKKMQYLLIALFAYALVIGAVYAHHTFAPDAWSEEGYASVTNIITVVNGIIPVVAGAFAVAFFGVKNAQGKAALLLVIGLAFWFVADIVWMFSENAIVSLADLFYLIGYPLLFAATHVGLLSFKPDYFKDSKRLFLLLIVCLIVVAAYLSFFPLSWDSETNALENLVTSGYVIVDLLLLVPLVFFVLLSLSRGSSAGHGSSSAPAFSCG